MLGFAYWWLIGGWIAWFGVVAFHGLRQPRRSTVARRPRATRAGFTLQTAAAVLPWFFQIVWTQPPGPVRTGAVIVMVPLSVWWAWISMRALGKQWRIDAALLPDHELVRKGPYRLVRHPVYASYFTMVLANGLLITSWPVIAGSAALFAIGTEIRVRAEDELLATRFGEDFEKYRRRVRAYLPLLR